jgi:hypothetical protein
MPVPKAKPKSKKRFDPEFEAAAAEALRRNKAALDKLARL